MNRYQMLAKYPCGYDLGAAAIVAGVHQNTIRNAIENKKIFPFRSVTGSPKIAPDELLRWLNERVVEKAN